MGKSKLRGGAKAHRKRVNARNQLIKSQIKKQEKMFQDAFMEQLEKMRESISGETQNQETSTSETIKLNTDGFVQSAEII
jgi:hypothetical protein